MNIAAPCLRKDNRESGCFIRQSGFVEDKGLYVEIKARKPSRLSLVLLFFNIFVDRKDEAIVVNPAKGLKKTMKALKEHCCRDNESVSKEKLSMHK